MEIASGGALDPPRGFESSLPSPGVVIGAAAPGARPGDTTIASDSGTRRREGAVAAQALVAADDVAPLHQPQPRIGVDRDDRGADQEAVVDLAAAAHLDLGADLVHGPGRVGQLQQQRRAVADRQRRCRRPARRRRRWRRPAAPARGRRRRSSALRRRPRSGRRAGAGAAARPRGSSSAAAAARTGPAAARSRRRSPACPAAARPRPGRAAASPSRWPAGRCRRGPGAACGRHRGRRRRRPASASP